MKGYQTCGALHLNSMHKRAAAFGADHVMRTHTYRTATGLCVNHSCLWPRRFVTATLLFLTVRHLTSPHE